MADFASHRIRPRLRIRGSQHMSRVLVTGASGFIGRQCLPILAAKGYDVHALSRRQLATPLPGLSWHNLDLLSQGAPSEIIHQVQPDFLLHLAWYAAPGKCLEEKTPLFPATLYGTCKHSFGRILDSFSRRTDLSAAWGRIFFLYGPYEHPSRLIAYVVQSLLRAQPALCSDGKQVLDFMHVEDAASAFVALLENKIQGPVNIASGRPVVVRDLLQEIGMKLGRSELIRLGERESSSEVSRIW